MQYIESPNVYGGRLPSLFVAGGITGCSNWQATFVNLLARTSLVVLNPRRSVAPVYGSQASEEQVLWEHEHLRQADAIAFWFTAETLCPIVLYELGAWSMTPKPLFVGIHPSYQRRHDVEVQTRLVRPDVPIVYSLEDLATAIIETNWIRQGQR